MALSRQSANERKKGNCFFVVTERVQRLLMMTASIRRASQPMLQSRTFRSSPVRSEMEFVMATIATRSSILDGPSYVQTMFDWDAPKVESSPTTNRIGTDVRSSMTTRDRVRGNPRSNRAFARFRRIASLDAGIASMSVELWERFWDSMVLGSMS